MNDQTLFQRKVRNKKKVKKKSWRNLKKNLQNHQTISSKLGKKHFYILG